jgi:hypothetical protein
VSTRRFSRTREPVGQDIVNAERSTSKSAVSREFVGRTGEHLRSLMSRSLADVRLAALMLDGLDLKGRCCVVCLGVTTDGVKVPLGLWDGSTEHATVARELLADLVDRGLDCDQGVPQPANYEAQRGHRPGRGGAITPVGRGSSNGSAGRRSWKCRVGGWCQQLCIARGQCRSCRPATGPVRAAGVPPPCEPGTSARARWPNPAATLRAGARTQAEGQDGRLRPLRHAPVEASGEIPTPPLGVNGDKH